MRSIDPQATHLAVFVEIKQLKAELADVEQMNHSLQRRIMDLESVGVVVEVEYEGFNYHRTLPNIHSYRFTLDHPLDEALDVAGSAKFRITRIPDGAA